jgi:AcrR family transcriptional regulator
VRTANFRASKRSFSYRTVYYQLDTPAFERYVLQNRISRGQSLVSADARQRVPRSGVRKSGADKPRQARGRPRKFDPDKALERAVDVFWRRGYEGASLQELTGAMGVNRPSLYATFGNKEELFRAALDHYQSTFAASCPNPLSAPTAREAVSNLLYGVAAFLGQKNTPPGCLITQTALACAVENEPIRRELNIRRESTFVAVRERLRRAKREGDLPEHSDPAALARYVAVIVSGLGVQAACGASGGELDKVVDVALRAWPD